MPAKPFKKDGSISASMIKWAEKHNATIDGNNVIAYGKEYKIRSREATGYSNAHATW